MYKNQAADLSLRSLWAS